MRLSLRGGAPQELIDFCGNHYQSQTAKKVADSFSRLLLQMYVRGEITEHQLYYVITGNTAEQDQVVFTDLPNTNNNEEDSATIRSTIP